MRKFLSAFILAALLCVPAAARAQDFIACALAGKIAPCPGNARLKTTYKIGASYLDLSGFVALTGAQTIAGVKTFSSAPVMSGASITSGTIPTTALASAPGSPVVIALFTKGAAENWYPAEFGSLAISSTGTATDTTPWCAPVAGTVRDLIVQGETAAGANSTVTVNSSAGGNTFLYSSSTVTCVVSTGDKSCRDNTHTLSLAQGDCVLPSMTAGQIWATGGASVSIFFKPN